MRSRWGAVAGRTLATFGLLSTWRAPRWHVGRRIGGGSGSVVHDTFPAVLVGVDDRPSTQVQRASLTGLPGRRLPYRTRHMAWRWRTAPSTGPTPSVAQQAASAKWRCLGPQLDPTFLLPPNVQSPYGGVATDDGYLYWANFYGHDLGRSTLAGTNPEPFVTTIPAPPTALAVDGNEIYWGTTRTRSGGRR